LEGISGRRRMNGEGKGRRIQSMHFVYAYEDKILKLVKVILSGGKGEEDEGE
jgi:hypothetical protein